MRAWGASAVGWLMAGALGMAVGQTQRPADAGANPKNQTAGTTSGQAPYTLVVQSRVVLTDVTVTDKHGNPVSGLSEDDFRIFDNGRPQTLASFEEHHEQAATAQETAAERSAGPGEFSNGYLRVPPPQVNVLLFDTTTIRIVDQMYLFEQMRRFVRDLPAGEPVAVFTRSGDMTVEVSAFTDDHETLLAAIRRAIPRLRQPGAWMASDEDTLRQMALYLSQVPGRKNLIWFTSGSNLFLNTNPDALGDALVNEEDRREIYDMLEQERIAIYPVDARGLTTYFNLEMGAQQIQMREDAASTGGEAYMNTNGLALAARRILATDGDYYTLTYAPRNLKENGKWHRVEVKLDRKAYRLSYRRGYYDDGSNQGKPPESRTRTRLRANGSREQVPNNRSEPIIFKAKVAAASATTPMAPGDPPVKRGETRYVVEYVVPAKDLYPESVEGGVGKDVVGLALLAFNNNGEPVARRMLRVTASVNEQKAETLPDGVLMIPAVVNLRPGRTYLYLGVWDTTTGRMGTVEAEVDVQKPGRSR